MSNQNLSDILGSHKLERHKNSIHTTDKFLLNYQNVQNQTQLNSEHKLFGEEKKLENDHIITIQHNEPINLLEFLNLHLQELYTQYQQYMQNYNQDNRKINNNNDTSKDQKNKSKFGKKFQKLKKKLNSNDKINLANQNFHQAFTLKANYDQKQIIVEAFVYISDPFHDESFKCILQIKDQELVEQSNQSQQQKKLAQLMPLNLNQQRPSIRRVTSLSKINGKIDKIRSSLSVPSEKSDQQENDNKISINKVKLSQRIQKSNLLQDKLEMNSSLSTSKQNIRKQSKQKHQSQTYIKPAKSQVNIQNLYASNVSGFSNIDSQDIQQSISQQQKTQLLKKIGPNEKSSSSQGNLIFKKNISNSNTGNISFTSNQNQSSPINITKQLQRNNSTIWNETRPSLFKIGNQDNHMYNQQISKNIISQTGNSNNPNLNKNSSNNTTSQNTIRNYSLSNVCLSNPYNQLTSPNKKKYVNINQSQLNCQQNQQQKKQNRIFGGLKFCKGIVGQLGPSNIIDTVVDKNAQKISFTTKFYKNIEVIQNLLQSPTKKKSDKSIFLSPSKDHIGKSKQKLNLELIINKYHDFLQLQHSPYQNLSQQYFQINSILSPHTKHKINNVIEEEGDNYQDEIKKDKNQKFKLKTRRSLQLINHPINSPLKKPKQIKRSESMGYKPSSPLKLISLNTTQFQSSKFSNSEKQNQQIDKQIIDIQPKNLSKLELNSHYTDEISEQNSQPNTQKNQQTISFKQQNFYNLSQNTKINTLPNNSYYDQQTDQLEELSQDDDDDDEDNSQMSDVEEKCGTLRNRMLHKKYLSQIQDIQAQNNNVILQQTKQFQRKQSHNEQYLPGEKSTTNLLQNSYNQILGKYQESVAVNSAQYQNIDSKLENQSKFSYHNKPSYQDLDTDFKFFHTQQNQYDSPFINYDENSNNKFIKKNNEINEFDENDYQNQDPKNCQIRKDILSSLKYQDKLNINGFKTNYQQQISNFIVQQRDQLLSKHDDSQHQKDIQIRIYEPDLKK
ncbi:hypothetical protein PPERSA_09847 [Pseudocohnilembus persalinus]|uniref:Uncharacterized protein n=1 Tax=Pseudocohnilembus persalinus TaxID=266149 RepID=A0A0V0QU25_PSEPJ|nr:hypothetical protein PPERSA_09847 [Pseudocohnilembus persalinus]|eukprot:KRX05707.1 hypothetical protein PPERSA_09847 [Pseudocohnilembus persalinus]